MPTQNPPHTLWHPLLALVLLATTAACGSTLERLGNVGQAPRLSNIEDLAAPSREGSLAQQMNDDLRGAQGVQGLQGASFAGPSAGVQQTSLFRTGSKAFFRDQRASRIGDILTVRINISDRAQVGNTTTRTRANSEQAGLPNFLGLESQLSRVLPNAVNPSNLINGTSQSSSTGNGQVQRSEVVDLTVAAIVTGVLPNGNLVVRGRQEVRVNFEVRELIIAGVVRPEDITRDNTVQHTQIAEARISYGGRGQLTDVQQARIGQQVYDALFPF
jgi:flagellar L-ring protein precursor FlgH